MSAKPNQQMKQDVAKSNEKANKENSHKLAEAVSAIVKTPEVVQNTHIEPVNENQMTTTQHTEEKIAIDTDSDKQNEQKTPKPSVNNQAELSIENTIQHLESVINNYKILNRKIHANKNKIAELQKTTISIRENKQEIEDKVQQNENDHGDTENIPNDTNSITDSNLIKKITDNKYFIKNKTCNNIKKNVEKIQNNIASDTKKSASYIEPLYLSCKLLKTHISYTQSLENTVAAFDIQRELELQQDDANELIKMLVDHFDAIQHYQPLDEDKIDNEQQNKSDTSMEKNTETQQNTSDSEPATTDKSSPHDASQKNA